MTLSPAPAPAPALPVLTARQAAGISRGDRSRWTGSLLTRAAGAADPERAQLLDQVVVLNCRVADAVAARYRDRGVPLEDLQQAAYEGLVKAVHRFDADRSEDLLTFAVPMIRGEVQRHFRDRSWMVRPPRRVQELQAQVNAVVRLLQDQQGREPSAALVCERLGIEEDEYAEAMLAPGCFRPASLDRPLGDDAGAVTLGDLIPDEDAEARAVEARCLLAPALRGLDDRQRRLLHLRFVEERSQREIAVELGLAQTQVSRLLDRLLRDLRQEVAPADVRARPGVPGARPARQDPVAPHPRRAGGRRGPASAWVGTQRRDPIQ